MPIYATWPSNHLDEAKLERILQFFNNFVLFFLATGKLEDVIHSKHVEDWIPIFVEPWIRNV